MRVRHRRDGTVARRRKIQIKRHLHHARVALNGRQRRNARQQGDWQRGVDRAGAAVYVCKGVVEGVYEDRCVEEACRVAVCGVAEVLTEVGEAQRVDLDVDRLALIVVDSVQHDLRERVRVCTQEDVRALPLEVLRNVVPGAVRARAADRRRQRARLAAHDLHRDAVWHAPAVADARLRRVVPRREAEGLSPPNVRHVRQRKRRPAFERVHADNARVAETCRVGPRCMLPVGTDEIIVHDHPQGG
mmetsp:Transcript_27489/g.53622  ORF Transcript_27489/g.53622 Transcript_27489/m.53622 type:complete len:245 (-) Transcript_27489:584-1318(-)